MMSYNVVQASQEQADVLYSKHLAPLLKVIPKTFNAKYVHDSEDDIGFVSFQTITGKTVQFQLRNGEPMYVSFTGFGSVRYDISDPTGDMLNLLTRIGNKACEDFWKGAEI